MMMQACCFGVILLFTVGVSLAADQDYCTFFQNRKPQQQELLTNCTWYKDYSCCRQTEIKITFAKVKPLQGASPECVRYLNYLMCYICAPDQWRFYGKEQLTVCEEFCDTWYKACSSAVLKGSHIKELYPSGRKFCESRSFQVDLKGSRGGLSATSRDCFFREFDPSDDFGVSLTGAATEPGGSMYLLLFLLIVVVITNTHVN